MQATQGKVLGERWICLEKIYDSAMSSVYRGVERQSQRPVAIKVLNEEKNQSMHWRERFEEESNLLQRLHHPHILRFLDRGYLKEDRPFFITAWAEGPSLRDWLKSSCFSSIKQLVPIVTGIVDALSYLHQLGIVHRDLKPANVLVASEPNSPTGQAQALLLDFGIAHLFQMPRKQEIEPYALGTPLYMSPEQAQNLPNIGPASDIYALGVILFEALTGFTPFQGDSIYSIMAGHVHVPPPLPREFAPIFQSMPEIERVLLWALEKSPSHRPADVWTFWSTLLGSFLQYGMITHEDLPTLNTPDEAAALDLQARPNAWEDLEESEDFLGLPLHPEAPTPRPQNGHQSEPIAVLPKPSDLARLPPQNSTPRSFEAFQRALSEADLPLHPEAPTPPQAHPNASDWLHAQSTRSERPPRDEATDRRSTAPSSFHKHTPADLSLFAAQTPAPRHTTEPPHSTQETSWHPHATPRHEKPLVYAQAHPHRTAQAKTKEYSFEEVPRLKERSFEEAPRAKGRSVEEVSQVKGRSFEEVSQVKGRSFEEVSQVKGRSFEEVSRVKGRSAEEAPQVKGRLFSTPTPIKQAHLPRSSFSWVDFFTRMQRTFQEVHGIGLYDLEAQSWKVNHATNSGYTGFLQFRLMLRAFHDLHTPSDGTRGLEFVVEGLHRQEDFSFYYAPQEQRWMLVVAMDGEASAEQAFRVGQRIRVMLQRALASGAS
ncbi:protein kinase [Myxococcota bacterium]|nr:protein kinase [Myxococcota bacterium]